MPARPETDLFAVNEASVRREVDENAYHLEDGSCTGSVFPCFLLILLLLNGRLFRIRSNFEPTVL